MCIKASGLAPSVKALLDRGSSLDGGMTGWPPGLLQDDCRKLFRWFADRVDSRRAVREALVLRPSLHETDAAGPLAPTPAQGLQQRL